MRVELQPAFILHHKDYRNNSLLLEALTRDFGRISLVARGVRSVRKAEQGKRALLQPFSSLYISYTGKHELQTLIAAESRLPAVELVGKMLYSGFYLNELLVRLLHRHDACEHLFQVYQETLVLLQGAAIAEPALRRFEYVLLQELGYGLSLLQDHINQQQIEDECRYVYVFGVGPVLCSATTSNNNTFSGRCLRAVTEQQFDHPECHQEIKRLMRMVLSQYLGDRPLKSRELFI